MINPEKKNLYITISLSILGIALYATVLDYPFIQNDLPNIVHNNAIRSLMNISGIWQKFTLRFLGGVSFAFNYSIGQLNVVGYHIFNIVVHIVNTFLVYRLVSLTMMTPALQQYRWSGRADFLALFAALVFLVHPGQSYTVVVVSERFTSMATLFYLLTMTGYVQARLNSKPQLVGWGLLFILAGLLTKEIILSVPIMLIVYEWFFLSSWPQVKEQLWKNKLPLFFAGVAVYFLVKFFAGSGSSSAVQSRLVREAFLEELVYAGSYFKTFVFPSPLVVSFNYVPKSYHLLAPGTFLPLFFLIGMIILGVKIFHKDRLMSFGIFWILIAMSVDVIAGSFSHRVILDDHLYLPMVGYGIVLAVTLLYLAKDEMGLKGLVGVIVIALCFMTLVRNESWRKERILKNHADKWAVQKCLNCQKSKQYVRI